MNYSRRSLLQTGAGAMALGAVAGCLDSPFGEETPDSGYAAFFALWDWAEEISGDAMEFENPVPTGRMGHGWEPEGDLQRNIADAGIFLYLDTPEFSWAQDAATSLEADYDHVEIVDAMAGLEHHLIPMGRGNGDREADDDHDFDPDTVEVGGLDLYDGRTDEEIAYWHGDHWHGNLPETLRDESSRVVPVFEDADGNVLPLGEDEQFQVDAYIVDGAAEVVEIDARGDHLVFEATEEGRTRVVIELVADGDVIWDTSNDNITLDVVEELEDSEAPQSPDPHVWVDPVIAQDVVETIAAALADIDPDNADTYEENAADYVERLATVDEELEAVAADAESDIAVFAGHDSFQYVEHRYDFELHTPTGVSADEDVSASDITDMMDVVSENDLDTILYDPFEDTDGGSYPPMVEVLLEDTDATEAAPLTPVEGTTEEWDENDWGWIEQMEEVNIPSLRQALRAD
ncbi:zinc ABC transporter substrate-binding protein [Halobacteria archaeon AArc-dxtr1]|nr:zinc ABC transporter substrate-binding protein [Halobacteria archaeon AArc-dxtr1]